MFTSSSIISQGEFRIHHWNQKNENIKLLRLRTHTKKVMGRGIFQTFIQKMSVEQSRYRNLEIPVQTKILTSDISYYILLSCHLVPNFKKWKIPTQATEKYSQDFILLFHRWIVFSKIVLKLALFSTSCF